MKRMVRVAFLLVVQPIRQRQDWRRTLAAVDAMVEAAAAVEGALRDMMVAVERTGTVAMQPQQSLGPRDQSTERGST